ncbi:hypothetical protein CR513_53514, partial [Mucuna pruriens]
MEQTVNASRGIQFHRCTKLVVENRKIFRNMACMDMQKVTLVAFMSNHFGEFQAMFLKEMLSNDVHIYKGMEFVELKHANKIVLRIMSNLESRTIPAETESESSWPSQLRPKASQPIKGIPTR